MTRWSVVPAFLAVVLAACSLPESDKTVSRDRLQEQIIQEVSDQAGSAPDSVTCPGDLIATVGAALDCTLTADGEQRDVNVTVGSAEGDKIDLHIVQTIGRESVAEQITEQISRQIGRAPESVTCPADLKGDEGATMRCELTDAGVTFGVTVTAVSRGDAAFDFTVDERPLQ